MAQANVARKIWEFLVGGPDVALKPGAVYLPSGPAMASGQKAVTTEAWQLSAWFYWHKLGEIRFPTEHLARQVGRLDWDVYVDGTQLSEDEALEFMDEITLGLGRREASRMLALNLQVPGEGWYLEKRPSVWAVYSVTTPKLEEKIKALRALGQKAYRCYFPDPVEPNHAESAVQTALGPAEELVTLEALSRAQSRSRIAQAGMLITPVEAEFEDGSDPFGADLERAMMAGIADVNDPAAMVPIKVEMEADLIEKVKHLDFKRAYDDKLHQRVEMAIKRIALALDCPADLLLGSADATHWTAWLTALETYTSHLEPLALVIGELYAEVGEELLERQGRRVSVVIEPNPAAILAKRSTVRDALDAAKLGAVSLAYVRTAIGADEEDAPTDEDLEIILRIPAEPGREPLVDEQRGQPEASGPSPVAASAQGATPRELAEIIQKIYLGVGVVVSAEEARAILNEAGATLDADTVPAPRARAGSLNGTPLGPAMSVTVSHVRSKVGAKLRAAVMSDPDMRDRIDGVPNDDVVFVLGGDVAAERIDVNAAVLDGLGHFRSWWESHQPGEATATVAATLFGVWIADTLAMPTREVLEVPDWLVAEVASGRPASKEVAHATAV